MATSDSSAQRNASLQSFVTSVGSSGVAELRTGSKPGPGSAATGTLLATLTFGSDILQANGGTSGTISSGVLTCGGYTQVVAASGTPGYMRWKTSGGTAIRDTDVSTAGSGNIIFSGSVTTGVSITGTITYTDGNP